MSCGDSLQVWGQPRPAEGPAGTSKVLTGRAGSGRRCGSAAGLGLPSSRPRGKLASGVLAAAPVSHLLLLIPKFRAFSQPWCRPLFPCGACPSHTTWRLSGLPLLNSACEALTSSILQLSLTWKDLWALQPLTASARVVSAGRGLQRPGGGTVRHAGHWAAPSGASS